MITKKVAATTVIEVAVAMAISAVVIAMAYSGFEMFAKMFRGFKATNEKNSEMLVFKRVLSNEIDASELLIKTDKGIELVSRAGAIRYEFSDDFILREKSNVIDTFHLNTIEKYFQYQQVEQLIEGELIDKISFRLVEDKNENAVELTKEYGADVYINKQLNASY